MGVERRGCVVQGVFIDQPEMGGISEYHQAISLAEQWEPDELRGSRPVLRAAGGEIPPADSPGYPKTEKKSIAVGMPLTEHPPHRSRRAQFTHRAPTLGV